MLLPERSVVLTPYPPPADLRSFSIADASTSSNEMGSHLSPPSVWIQNAVSQCHLLKSWLFLYPLSGMCTPMAEETHEIVSGLSRQDLQSQTVVSMETKIRKLDPRQWNTSFVGDGTIAMRKMTPRKRVRPPPQNQKRDNSSQAQENIVGCRISHGWKEANEPVTHWKAIVLDQLPTNPTLYFVKYDGIDCVYGLELHSDPRIFNLKILPPKMSFPQGRYSHLASTIVGRSVQHKFENKHGSLDEWKGMVIGEVPIMKTWFYITYEKDPVLYTYQLLDDYVEGNLYITPASTRGEVMSEVDSNVFIGQHREYITDEGTRKMGRILYQVLAKPLAYFIKFDNDFHIYVYDLGQKFL
ncbi:hypothetical protein STEG23_007806 [Scotinomys teguina]